MRFSTISTKPTILAMISTSSLVDDSLKTRTLTASRPKELNQYLWSTSMNSFPEYWKSRYDAAIQGKKKPSCYFVRWCRSKFMELSQPDSLKIRVHEVPVRNFWGSLDDFSRSLRSVDCGRIVRVQSGGRAVVCSMRHTRGTHPFDMLYDFHQAPPPLQHLEEDTSRRQR